MADNKNSNLSLRLILKFEQKYKHLDGYIDYAHLKETKYKPIDIHTPLWLWSRNGFKEVK